jgi:SAM-dependent methyltransferase
MNVKDLQRDWDAFGKSDALWAILTQPGKRGRWQLEEFFQTGVREIAGLFEYLDSLGVRLKRGKALDFGCGVGRLTQALSDHFEEVHGVDIAPSMIELAKRYNRHGSRCLHHVNASPSLDLFPDGTFDLVYSNITLQHIEPEYCARYLREFIRVLAPSGVLVFQLPARPINRVKAAIKRRVAKGILQLFRTFGYVKRPIMVMHGIGRSDVERIMDRAGAKIRDVQVDHAAGKDWLSHRYCVIKSVTTLPPR